MITLFRLLAILAFFLTFQLLLLIAIRMGTEDNPHKWRFTNVQNSRECATWEKIWESGDINITVYCDNAPGGQVITHQKMSMPGSNCPK